MFGKPEEWRAFDARHPAWESSAARLRAALERAFLRDVPVDEKGLHFIFALGRIAVEDFAEILLLSGNGYGIGALKILRGMYERVVTALYLSKHVDETDGLLKYDYVHRRKLLNHARNAGIDLSAHAQQVAEIEREYQQIKDDYKEVVCRECGTTKTQSSWTQRDLKTMADEVGLGNAYGLMYFWPTLQHHTTLAGVNTRFDFSDDDVATFDDGAQYDEVEQALGSAHMLLLILMHRFNELFGFTVPSIRELEADFKRCWNLSLDYQS